MVVVWRIKNDSVNLRNIILQNPSQANWEGFFIDFNRHSGLDPESEDE
jgi:hypothetical protein